VGQHSFGPALLGLLLSAALLGGCDSGPPEQIDNAMAPAEDLNLAAVGATPPDQAANAAADPAAEAYCERTRSFLSRADCARYEEIWQKADLGSGAISAPPAVRRGETVRIAFALSGKPNDAAPEAALGGTASKRVDAIKVSRYMGAQLTGNGFAIKSDKLQVKDLGLGPLQRWEWDATALKAADHRLTLSVYMVVRDRGAETSTLLKSTDIPLAVRVTTGDRLRDTLDSSQDWMTRGTNWLKALAALLAAALAVWVAARKFRKPDGGKDEGAKG
jgi:hypothetical protein